MTDHCDSLHAYVDGELGEAETTAFELRYPTGQARIGGTARENGPDGDGADPQPNRAPLEGTPLLLSSTEIAV